MVGWPGREPKRELWSECTRPPCATTRNPWIREARNRIRHRHRSTARPRNHHYGGAHVIVRGVGYSVVTRTVGAESTHGSRDDRWRGLVEHQGVPIEVFNRVRSAQSPSGVHIYNDYRFLFIYCTNLKELTKYYVVVDNVTLLYLVTG